MNSIFEELWIRNAICFTLFLFAWLVFCSSEAYAAVPRKEAIVSGSEITLGDVFEGVNEHADHFLAPAPDPGRVMVLDAAALNRIARAFGFTWRAQSPFEKIVIRRAATVIDTNSIVKTLRQALTEKGMEGKFEVELYNRSLTLTLPGDVAPKVRVSALDFDPARGEFEATLLMPAADKAAGKPVHVSGRVHRIVDVPVLTRRLRNGDVIGRDDLQMVDMRLAELAPEIVTDPQKLVGKTPRRSLSELQPVRAGEIQAPVVVTKGEMVTMMLKNKSLSLITQGRALQNGAEGETIRIINPASNQVVEAVVTGIKQVSVQPASSVAIN